MSVFPFKVVVALLGSLILLQDSPAVGESTEDVAAWQTRLQQEAVPAWSSLKKAIYNEVCVEVSLWRFDIQNQVPMDVSRVSIPDAIRDEPQIRRKYRLSKLGERIDSTNQWNGKRTDVIQAANPSYSYAAVNKNENDWMATDVSRVPMDRIPRLGPGTHANDLLRAYATVAAALEELVLDPTFAVQDVEHILDEVLFTYSCNIEDSGGEFRYTGGRLRLAPARNWLPIWSELDAEDIIPTGQDGSLSKARTLEAWEWTTLDENKVPRRLNVIFEVDGEQVQALVLSYDQWRHAAFSDGDFRMSAIGLPEPRALGPLEGRLAWKLIFVLNLVVVILAVIGLLNWRLARGRSSAQINE